MKIVVTGATGFVGRVLVDKLSRENHHLLILTRNPEKCRKIFTSTDFPNLEFIGYRATESGPWQEVISGCDAVINLAGEPISQRWTPEYKQSILDSRQLGTAKIVEAINKAAFKPKVLVNASAIGYYGTSETATFDETNSAGQDFLAQVCQVWEAEAQKLDQKETRLVILRLGIVLGKGGALGKMLTPFKAFAGGPLGSGNQWFSWIHILDLVDLILYSIENSSMTGVFNATSPNPVRMSELCQILAEVIHRPSWLPVPDFALEILLGEAAKIVLEGQQVIPKRTQAAGFVYKYPNLKEALSQILESSEKLMINKTIK